MSLVLSLWTTRAKEKHKETFEFEEEKTREIVYFDRNTLRKKKHNPVGIKEEKDGTYMTAFFATMFRGIICIFQIELHCFIILLLFLFVGSVFIYFINKVTHRRQKKVTHTQTLTIKIMEDSEKINKCSS